MRVFFELFDLKSGNVIEDFETEHDAIAALVAAEREHGSQAIENIALLRFEDGHPLLVAMEQDLVDRVNALVYTERVGS
jgi:hypothetical protein